MIAGATMYYGVSATNRVALCDLVHIWSHGGKPGDLFGLLNAATLVANGDVDGVRGQGGKDFFLLHTSGPVNDVHDAAGNETVTNV